MFFLKDKNKDSTAIEIIVRYKGQRYKYPTGERVNPDFWLKDKARCKEGRVFPDGADINIRLGIWEKHVKDILTGYSLQFRIPSQDEFRSALKAAAFGDEVKPGPDTGLVAFAKHFKESSDRSPDTKKVYQTAINWIEEYEKEIGKSLKFTDIDSAFYVNFKAFVFKSGRIHSPNTFGTMIKNIKVFMDNSKNLHKSIGHKQSDFKRMEVESDNIYLTVDELIKLHSFVIDEAIIKEEYPQLVGKIVALKMKALDLARCKFLIGAFTALRVSDFKRIEEININDNRIRIRTYKGDKAVVIPVHWVIKELLDKGFDMSAKVSEQKINKHIKRICKYAGITDPVTLTRFKAGKRIATTKQKYEWVTTHTARRSGATNMFIAGIPAISIMKITGHRTEKSFLKYIKISQEENAELLANHAFFVKEVKKSPGDGESTGTSTQTSN